MLGLTSVFGMGTGVTPALWAPITSLYKYRPVIDVHAELIVICKQFVSNNKHPELKTQLPIQPT